MNTDFLLLNDGAGIIVGGMEKSPLFIATHPFDPSVGERWTSYIQWAKISGLVEVVIRRSLAERYPEDPHAQCELWAIWRLNQ